MLVSEAMRFHLSLSPPDTETTKLFTQYLEFANSEIYVGSNSKVIIQVQWIIML